MIGLISLRNSINQYGDIIYSIEENYIKFFNELNIKLILLPNNSIDLDWYYNSADFIILSGGGSVPREYLDMPINYEDLQINRDSLEKQLVKKAYEDKKPLIGICRGMQFINGYFGGKVSNLNSIRKIGLDHEIKMNDNIILVNNYHEYGILEENLAKGFIVLAKDLDYDIVESIYRDKVLGIQWHPERKFICEKSREFSKELIKNFLINGGKL